MINFTDISFDEIEARCVESNHTRIPVYENDPDKIIGILHFRDFFTLKSCNENPTVEDVRGILMKPQYASSETTLLTQLTEFKKTKNHMAIVVDEYGIVLGVVTLEDIVEEIVGDIEDEHDETHDEGIKILEDGSVLCGGTVLVRDFCKKTGIDLQNTTGVSTIAGLAIHIAHKIPKISDTYTYLDYNIEIMEADFHKVQSVKFTKKSEMESIKND
jgi:CBS domain containing-hemolysin-like protein